MSVLIYCYYIKKLYMWSTNLGINQTIKSLLQMQIITV
jgi:hypothetical protein